MTGTIIFSRNRAMQLDALLRSMRFDGASPFGPAWAICRASEGSHETAYRVCEDEHRDVYFAAEVDLVEQVKAILERVEGLACFLTDDSVFYRQPMIPSALAHGVLCHSFRLGKNTTECYPLSCEQRLPDFREADGEIDWAWREAEGDFGYPGSLDGHVFRASHLRRSMATCREDANPNRIEEHLTRWVGARLAGEFPLMTAEVESSLVGIPANRVNETHPNRVGSGPSANELCARYLAGERLAPDRMDFSDVRGAHQEIPLVFENRT